MVLHTDSFGSSASMRVIARFGSCAGKGAYGAYNAGWTWCRCVGRGPAPGCRWSVEKGDLTNLLEDGPEAPSDSTGRREPPKQVLEERGRNVGLVHDKRNLRSALARPHPRTHVEKV